MVYKGAIILDELNFLTCFRIIKKMIKLTK